MIKVGYADMKPYTYTLDGKVCGSYNDLMRQVIARSGQKYVITEYPMNRLTLYLSTGAVHVWIGIGGALALNGTVRQGNVRVDLVRLMLYSNGPPKVKTLWELSNVPLIIISGLSYMGIGRRLKLAPNDLSFIVAPDHFIAFKLLKKGRAKYLLNYEVTSQLGVKSMESADLRAMVVQKIPLYFLVSNALDNAGELLAKLDQALLDIRKEDTYSIADQCSLKAPIIE